MGLWPARAFAVDGGGVTPEQPFGLGSGLVVAAVRVGDDAEAEFRDVVFADHPGLALSASGRASLRVVGTTFSGNGRNLLVGDAAVVELSEVRIVGPTAAPARD